MPRHEPTPQTTASEILGALYVLHDINKLGKERARQGPSWLSDESTVNQEPTRGVEARSVFDAAGTMSEFGADILGAEIDWVEVDMMPPFDALGEFTSSSVEFVAETASAAVEFVSEAVTAPIELITDLIP